MGQLSPMMRQYLEIKEKNKDKIVFFRLGDFYEMFFEDAKIASAELEIALTGRDCGLDERAPMCGVPYHSCEAYIARLIDKGYKVAICEQTEDPATAKGIVNRDIVRVITPGTVIEESMLTSGDNNYLASLYFEDKLCGVCFVDASTGEINYTEIEGFGVEQKLLGELGRFMPSEMVTSVRIKEKSEITSFMKDSLGCCLTTFEDEEYTEEISREILKKHFGVENLTEKGIPEKKAAIIALAIAIKYLYNTQMVAVERLNSANYYTLEKYMRLDFTAMRNLEICENLRSNDKKGTLLWVLDHTKTALGKRLIRKWTEQPLMDVFAIESRLNSVDELCSNNMLCSEIRQALVGILDIERLMTRIVYGTAGGRELRSFCNLLVYLPHLKELVENCNSKMLKLAAEKLDLLEDLRQLIDAAIVNEPPVSVREGGIIKDGYSKELDEVRYDLTNGKNIIRSIEAKEKERTGIKTLKVGYNKVFGYYIEVSNSFKEMVPPEYIRKQTLVNGERFITDELKNLEARVLGAKEISSQMEFAIFDGIRKTVADAAARVQNTANSIALIDTIASLSYVSAMNNYCRPTLSVDGKMNIVGGRHPVAEQIVNTPFVPNDTVLDSGENRCAIITGPNMAGKSTYMRQVALITLMAQIGCFVPAQSAQIPITDAIFTRVGASDDLTTGRSTFMVEMSEVAHILKNATSHSLLILDEIGRGTSTFDGMSIARAVLEFVVDKKKIGAKTLFATHYHELTQLEEEIEGVKNYNVAVKKKGDDITFLRRIVRGGADQSYGVEVAKLSGIPSKVIDRAKEILQKLENEGVTIIKREDNEVSQIDMELQSGKNILEELKMLDVNTLTPIECMQALDSLVKMAKNI